LFNKEQCEKGGNGERDEFVPSSPLVGPAEPCSTVNNPPMEVWL